MKEYEEKVRVVMTMPKPVLKYDDRAKKLVGKRCLFDQDECLVEDEDPDGYYGDDDIMSVLVFTRTLPVSEAVKMAEKAVGIKGTSGDAIIDIKYLFKRLQVCFRGNVDFDLYNADTGSMAVLYHSEGPLFMPQASRTIPNVLKAIRGGTDDEMNERRSALGWILCEFFGMPYKQTLDRVYSYSTPAELRYELAEAYHEAASRYRMLTA